jgi:ABC-type bacteriocin/lantibiotic exporter with double-glycine peptidase domain
VDLQSGLHDCGAVATSNALQAIGIASTPEAVRELAGTTGDGTGAAGLKTAARKLGADVALISTRDPSLAHDALRGALHAGASAVLLVDDSDHWVSAIGVNGSRILVFDSACTKRKMVTAFERGPLLEAWRCKRLYYAVVLRRRT